MERSLKLEIIEMRRTRILLMLTGVALVGAACSPSGSVGPDPTPAPVAQDPVPDPTAPSDGDPASSGFVVDGGLTIPEAIAYEGDQVLAIKGFVVRDDQTDAFCELLAESYPPLCGGATLIIENPEATDSMVLQEAGGVQWSDEYVTLFGRISDGHLTIDTTVIG